MILLQKISRPDALQRRRLKLKALGLGNIYKNSGVKIDQII
jgi:hypothetical protein